MDAEKVAYVEGGGRVRYSSGEAEEDCEYLSYFLQEPLGDYK